MRRPRLSPCFFLTVAACVQVSDVDEVSPTETLNDAGASAKTAPASVPTAAAPVAVHERVLFFAWRIVTPGFAQSLCTSVARLTAFLDALPDPGDPDLPPPAVGGVPALPADTAGSRMTASTPPSRTAARSENFRSPVRTSSRPRT
ncbi:hypothetical protein [Streptomyces sp. NPDC093260]|uniref:hypothetical protein n=1 Tax=Streptomyces sp. NPDC093260 TaxID=3155073 RepID=UPI0034175B43